MLRLITNPAEVTRCHQILKTRLQPFAPLTRSVSIGFRGDNVGARVHYSRSLGIWWFFYDNGSSYWNPFGIGEPSPKRATSIVCEINYVKRGRPTSLSGGFASDSSGNVILIHSGRIGGGRTGIGRSLFLDNYVGEILDVQLDHTIKEYAPIGSLSSERFPFQLALFVKEIARIKHVGAPSSADQLSTSASHRFHKEFAGVKTYRSRRDLEAQCDHGLVVSGLQQVLMRRGHRAANDVSRDLYTLGRHGTIDTVFEIKTDISTQSLYTAIGQLLLNNSATQRRPQLVLVIPSRLPKATESTLQQIGIRTLVYSWRNNKPHFPRLDSKLDL